MINVVTGLPGSGKSYFLANLTVDLLYRNRKWFEKSGIRRQVATNLKMSKEIEDEFGWGTDESFITYWLDAEEVPKLRDCDVIWEEMGVIVDSRSWENMPLELRRWFAQHRHRGIEIYGNVQEFADVDVAVRRLTQNLDYLIKLCGSRDPHPTAPTVKFVWGCVARFSLDAKNYKEDEKFTKGRIIPNGFFFLSKNVVKLYDMHNDIKPGKYPSLQHRLRKCDTCGFSKVAHV